MPALGELQARFIGYLTGEHADMASMVEGKNRDEQDSRLAIYKNAYRIRLRQVLETDHDILWSYLGDELFAQAVTGYIDSHPSGHTSLRHFCDRLPAFLSTTPPFDQHPIIAEIATFERRLMDSFDAGDAERAGIDELRSLAPDAWPGMQLRFHPSVQLLLTHWNSIESWKALKDDTDPPAAHAHAEQYWLIWRDTDRLSQFRPLAEDEQPLLSAALEGATFADLCESLLHWYPGNEASVAGLNYITGWLDQGLVAQIVTGR